MRLDAKTVALWLNPTSWRFWLLFSVGMVVGLGGLLVLIFVVVHPPPGQAVASTPVVSGQPFGVTWTSDGEPQRVWLDAHAQWFGFPIRGSARVTAGGAPVATEEIWVELDGGFTVHHASINGDETLEGHLLFELPAQPAGTAMRVDGSMVLRPQTTVTSTEPGRSYSLAPPHELRVWVAP